MRLTITNDCIKSKSLNFLYLNHLLLLQLQHWLMKLKEAFDVSTTCIQFCSSDVFHVFESVGKVILSDISYQTDIWLRFANTRFNLPPL